LDCWVIYEHLFGIYEAAIKVVLMSFLVGFSVFQNFSSEYTFLKDILLSEFLKWLLSNLIILLVRLFNFEFIFWNILVG